MAFKQFRNWFFQPTGTPGTRFLKYNKPTENVFRDFLASIGFFKEVSDTASTDQQGFVKKATSAQIASRSSNDPAGFTLAVNPAQLPKVTLNNNPITPVQDPAGADVYNVTTTSTTVSQNNTPITPVSGNYNVNTILENVVLYKTLMNALPVNGGNTFYIANSTLVSDNMTVYPQYNTLTGSAFSYNSTTGIITINKTGWYNLEVWNHFGENVAGNWWITNANPELNASGHFLSAIMIASGPGAGNCLSIDTAVFYIGNAQNPAGMPSNPQHYVDMYLSKRGIHLTTGFQFFIRIQNNTVNANPGPGQSGAGGLVEITMQLIALG